MRHIIEEARPEDAGGLIRVCGPCPLCGDLTEVDLLPEEVAIMRAHGRLCSTCFARQKDIR